jgi:hypothetical protein
MTTSPHDPIIFAADFLVAFQAVAAEQRFRPHHVPDSHDAFLASAARAPRVRSLTPKLMSSFDLTAVLYSANHAHDGCECDERTPSDDASSDPTGTPSCSLLPPAASSDTASTCTTLDRTSTPRWQASKQSRST